MGSGEKKERNVDRKGGDRKNKSGTETKSV